MLQVQGDNQASFSHEIIAGAASYEAMKAYENHCNENGDPGSHEKAKEILFVPSPINVFSPHSLLTLN
jgi:hypothetical protein